MNDSSSEDSENDNDESVRTIMKPEWKSKYLAGRFGDDFPTHSKKPVQNVLDQREITANDLSAILQTIRKKTNQQTLREENNEIQSAIITLIEAKNNLRQVNGLNVPNMVSIFRQF